MSDKIFNTRIINKHDLEANWIKAVNFTPKQGELIIYDVDENYSYERFKIGDGATLVNELPFVDETFIIASTNIVHGTDGSVLSSLLVAIEDRLVALEQQRILNMTTTIIYLPAAGWTGVSSPYSQPIELNGVTANSKIDLQPTPEQIAELQLSEIVLTIENTDSIVMAYSINGKPEKDYYIQATITDMTPVDIPSAEGVEF